MDPKPTMYRRLSERFASLLSFTHVPVYFPKVTSDRWGCRNKYKGADLRAIRARNGVGRPCRR